MLRSLSPQYKQAIDVMCEDEAIALLLKAADLPDTTRYQIAATAIVRELGHLPLAVNLAGAYIASGMCFIEDFCADCRVNHRTLLKADRFSSATVRNQTVFTTWDLSCSATTKAASTEDPKGASVSSEGAKAAIQILELFAFFHNEHIPECIFKNAAENSLKVIDYGSTTDENNKLRRGTYLPEDLIKVNSEGRWDNFLFREGIKVLMSYSLIARKESGRHYSLHSLVHDWNSDRTHLKEDPRYVLAAGDLISASICMKLEPDGYIYQRAVLPHIRSLVPQSGFASRCGFYCSTS